MNVRRPIVALVALTLAAAPVAALADCYINGTGGMQAEIHTAKCHANGGAGRVRCDGNTEGNLGNITFTYSDGSHNYRCEINVAHVHGAGWRWDVSHRGDCGVQKSGPDTFEVLPIARRR
ncbi:MAG TPA: hypothetical protein VMF11_11010 [Candidatus Baltobacteraceae bacterium]|nr:hypothetical protein [Candidatus Baltobacteraceae bacterium]